MIIYPLVVLAIGPTNHKNKEKLLKDLSGIHKEFSEFLPYYQKDKNKIRHSYSQENVHRL